MVTIEWKYSSFQTSPYIELECSESELAEAKETLSESEFGYWIEHTASGRGHIESMKWAREEGGE
jgi:hypothetical protein